MQRTLASQDVMMKYIEHTGSAVFACPPGVAEGSFWVKPCSPERRATLVLVIGLTDPAQKLILRKRLIFKIIMGLFVKINLPGLVNVVDGPSIGKITGGVNRPCLCGRQLPSDLCLPQELSVV